MQPVQLRADLAQFDLNVPLNVTEAKSKITIDKFGLLRNDGNQGQGRSYALYSWCF